MKRIILALATSVSLSAFAGIGPTSLVEGYITRINDRDVIVMSRGKEVKVPKKFVSKSKMKLGQFVSVVMETPKIKNK